MDQSVMTFADSAARGSAIGTATEGMVTYLEDTDGLELWNGTAWVQVITPGAWVAYTPSFSNFTLGNGTLSAFFTRIGRTVIARVRIVLGSTSSMGNFPNLTLPVASKTGLSYPILGSGILIIEDAGTRDFFGKMRITSTTNADFVTDLVQGTGIGIAFLNATTPMTWAVNDKLNFQIIYEAGA
jgi:hypothetical protein